MKGQIAIWNPYVKVNNHSLFYCWSHLGANILTDQDESRGGSVASPYLSVRAGRTATFLVWFKSSIAPRPQVSAALGPVTSPRPVNRDTETHVGLVFPAGCPVCCCKRKGSMSLAGAAPRSVCTDLWAASRVPVPTPG